MQYNHSRVQASDLYLLSQWDAHAGTAIERRNKIFSSFARLGLRERWKWHAEAERCEYGHFTAGEKGILACRDWRTRGIAMRLGDGLERVLVVGEAEAVEPVGEEKTAVGEEDSEDEEDADVVDGEVASGFRTDDGDLVVGYNGDVFEVLPEVVYSMTAFDHPDDVEEARRGSRREMSLWVTGVYWRGERIVWVDEFGGSVRERVCDLRDREGMREAAEAFERFRPFESSWWTEAVAVGRYAEDGWWR